MEIFMPLQKNLHYLFEPYQFALIKMTATLKNAALAGLQKIYSEVQSGIRELKSIFGNEEQGSILQSQK